MAWAMRSIQTALPALPSLLALLIFSSWGWAVHAAQPRLSAPTVTITVEDSHGSLIQRLTVRYDIDRAGAWTMQREQAGRIFYAWAADCPAMQSTFDALAQLRAPAIMTPGDAAANIPAYTYDGLRYSVLGHGTDGAGHQSRVTLSGGEGSAVGQTVTRILTDIEPCWVDEDNGERG